MSGKCLFLQLFRCPGVDRQGMDAVRQHAFQGSVDHAVALDGRLAGEGCGSDRHMEMALALARMAGMLVPFVGHHQRFRRQGSRQQRMNLGNFRFRHGLLGPKGKSTMLTDLPLSRRLVNLMEKARRRIAGIGLHGTGGLRHLVGEQPW